MTLKKILATTVVAGGMLAATSPANASGGTFTTLDVPGVTTTEAFGINDARQVVGFFEDASGNIHGFVEIGGSFTTIDVPGAFFTQAHGINDAGQIVGDFLDNFGGHGF